MMLQVGVKAFLRNNDGKYLFLHRSSVKYPGTRGTWDIPGGRIEIGSRLIDNLRREVKEETQLNIISDFEPVLIAAQDIIPNDEKHVVRLTYCARTEGEPVLDTTENVEYRWLSLAELKQWEDLDIYAKELIEKGYLNTFED
jgi:ADP-ribose pyrophosphatase YjhB (NUDIX family)